MEAEKFGIIHKTGKEEKNEKEKGGVKSSISSYPSTGGGREGDAQTGEEGGGKGRFSFGGRRGERGGEEGGRCPLYNS